jgi:hypothetical protein
VVLRIQKDIDLSKRTLNQTRGAGSLREFSRQMYQLETKSHGNTFWVVPLPAGLSRGRECGYAHRLFGSEISFEKSRGRPKTVLIFPESGP